MNRAGYEYWGLKASTWDLIRGDTSGWEDRDFYRNVIRESGEPALDVGCGTGRLLLGYLAEGIDIDGVDNSPEMLDLCKQKARAAGLMPGLFEQSMQSLALPRKYRTIIVPSSSFQLLIEPSHAREAMCRFHRHLLPGGTLAMPFTVIHPGEAATDTVVEDWRCVGEKVRPQDGATVRLWSRRVLDLKQRLEHTRDRFEVLKEGQIVRSEEHARSPATRWYAQHEAAELYVTAGFADIRLLSGFTFCPATGDETLFCVLGTKPHGGNGTGTHP